MKENIVRVIERDVVGKGWMVRYASKIEWLKSVVARLLSSANHTEIGNLYVLFGVFAGIVGGVVCVVLVFAELVLLGVTSLLFFVLGLSYVLWQGLRLLSYVGLFLCWLSLVYLEYRGKTSGVLYTSLLSAGKDFCDIYDECGRGRDLSVDCAVIALQDFVSFLLLLIFLLFPLGITLVDCGLSGEVSDLTLSDVGCLLFLVCLHTLCSVYPYAVAVSYVKKILYSLRPAAFPFDHFSSLPFDSSPLPTASLTLPLPTASLTLPLARAFSTTSTGGSTLPKFDLRKHTRTDFLPTADSIGSQSIPKNLVRVLLTLGLFELRALSIACHLYPKRMYRFSEGVEHLAVWGEVEAGYAQGRRKVTVDELVGLDRIHALEEAPFVRVKVGNSVWYSESYLEHVTLSDMLRIDLHIPQPGVSKGFSRLAVAFPRTAKRTRRPSEVNTYVNLLLQQDVAVREAFARGLESHERSRVSLWFTTRLEVGGHIVGEDPAKAVEGLGGDGTEATKMLKYRTEALYWSIVRGREAGWLK